MLTLVFLLSKSSRYAFTEQVSYTFCFGCLRIRNAVIIRLEKATICHAGLRIGRRSSAQKKQKQDLSPMTNSLIRVKFCAEIFLHLTSYSIRIGLSDAVKPETPRDTRMLQSFDNFQAGHYLLHSGNTETVPDFGDLWSDGHFPPCLLVSSWHCTSSAEIWDHENA